MRKGVHGVAPARFPPPDRRRGRLAPVSRMSVSVTHAGAVAIVTIDNPPVNAASHAVRAGLAAAVTACAADDATRAVVLACAGRGFVAGADIREFGRPPQPPHLPDLIDAIEASPKPWVAAIHGAALGGGLELAMACHARIATADARLGLPEVTLGLIPGAGGTVRLPRLVPAGRALAMVSGGKPIDAATALADGLVDAIAAGDLRTEACALASAIVEPRPTLSRPANRPDDPDGFARLAGQARARARGQQSVAEAVDAIERALALPAGEALRAERAAFLRLKSSPQAAALQHMFFAERSTLKDPRCAGPARPVGTVGVIGGGTMGAGIAAACLIGGLSVILVERDREAAAAGRGRVEAILGESVARGVLDGAAREAALARLATDTAFGGLGRADLVIEAVFEDMAIKKDVFARLDGATRPDAVLATNTSYLDVNEIASVLADPARAIGLHFFAPAQAMKLLEIVLPGRVADDVVATAAAFARRLGKIGVLAGVCDGFIGNRIMSAYRREADSLVEDGALPGDIDAAMRDYGFPIGVFEMQDLAGLDIGQAARRRRQAAGVPAGRHGVIADLLCEAGRLGRKTGAGWYDYVDGRPVPSPAVTAMIAAERRRRGIADQPGLDRATILARLLDALRAEARAVVADGIAASADDVDVVMVNGFGYPRWRGGPLHDGVPVSA